MSWINEILDVHKEYESPLPFWYWAGLTSISAVVKDNVWVERGLYKSYANIYVILHADSGLKKGPPIAMANQLVHAVDNTTIIYGRSSIQAILKKLGTAETMPGGKVVGDSKGFICASELAASLVEDPAALGILTDLYDRIFHSNAYVSLLKSETFTLKSPTVSLLGGINDAHAESLFTKRDIQGGFIARCFIVHESKRNAVNALIDLPDKVPDYKELAKYLKVLASLRGSFAPLAGTGAGDLYKEWYHGFVKQIEEQNTKDSTGTLNRFSESVMKVAMLLALSEKPELVISRDAMEQAIEHCQKLIGNVRHTTLGAGKHLYAIEKAILIKELVGRNPHIISREQVNRKYFMNASLKDWSEVALQLEAAGIIKIVNHGVQVMYEMTPEQVDAWEKHFRGR